MARTARAAPPSDSDRIVDAAFARIAAQGWRSLSLAAIAAEADLPIVRVYRHFPSKTAVLRGFLRRIDEAVLSAAPVPDDSERSRDRVFDLLMRRFDALGPYKPGLAVLRRELPFDPPAALAAAAQLLCSMRVTLEAAGIATGGIGGIVAVKLTAAAYFAASRVWARDDSADLSPTMAMLDQRLRGFERWLDPASRRGAARGAAEA